MSERRESFAPALEHPLIAAPQLKSSLRATDTDTLPRARQRHTTRRAIAEVAASASVAYLAIATGTVLTGLLVTHVLAHGWVGTTERSFMRWLDAHGSTALGDASTGGTFLGSTLTVAAIAASVTGLLLLLRWGRRSWMLAIGLLIELAVFLTANYVVARPRPTVRHLGLTPSTYSYPSGHTAAAVVLYGGIAVVVMAATTRRLPRVVAWTCAALLVLAVGLSRIYRGDHYPTDVLCGAVVGVAALVVAVHLTRTILDRGQARTKPDASAHRDGRLSRGSA